MIRLLLLSIFVLLCLQLNAQSKQKRLALVIGNADYEYAGKLKFPADDAGEISKSLENLDFTVIKGINCNQEAMGEKIQQYLSLLDEYNVALFYYSGHGINLNGFGYILSVDANMVAEEEFGSGFYSLDSLIVEISNAKLDVNIIITDAYRANKFQNRKIRPGFAYRSAPDNFYIVYSATPGSVCCPSYSKDGLFAQVLLKYLEQPDLKIKYVFKSVRRDIYQLTDKKQMTFDENSLNKEFYFKE